MITRSTTQYALIAAAVLSWSCFTSNADEPTAANAAAKPREPINVILDVGPTVLAGAVNVPDGESDITVAKVFEQLWQKSPNLIRLQTDAKIMAVQRRRAVDDDLAVRQVETPLAVEWDAKTNGPTDETNHKLRPGDRIVVKPSPENMPFISPPVPAASNGYRYLPAGAIIAPQPAPAQGAMPGAMFPAAGTTGTPQQPTAVSAYRPPTATPQAPTAVAYATATPAYGPPSLPPTNAYAPMAAPASIPPFPGALSSAVPFFGAGANIPVSVQYREVAEEFVNANGEKAMTVRRIAVAVPAPMQMTFKIKLIEDPHDSLNSFAAMHNGSVTVADTDILNRVIQLLRQHQLLPESDAGEMSASGPSEQEISGGTTSTRTLTDDAGHEQPGDAREVQFSLIPKNMAGRLCVEMILKYSLSGKKLGIDAVCEVGRGQSILARLKPTADDDVPNRKDEADKPLYALVTPIGEPIVNAPAMLPARADVFPTPQPAPQAAPAAVPRPASLAAPMPAATPSTVAPNPTLVMRYEAQPAASPAIAAGAQWLAPTQAAPQPSTVAPQPAAAANVTPGPQYAVPAAAPASYDAPATPSPARPIAADAPKSNIQFSITVVEDTSGSIAEFLRPTNSTAKVADTATLRAALRILEKQKLIRRLSDAKAVTAFGVPAMIEADAPKGPADGLEIYVSGRLLGDTLDIKFNMLQTERERKLPLSTDMAVTTGKSIIAKTHPGGDLKAAGAPEMQVDDPETKDENPVYVILTPDLVR